MNIENVLTEIATSRAPDGQVSVACAQCGVYLLVAKAKGKRVRMAASGVPWLRLRRRLMDAGFAREPYQQWVLGAWGLVVSVADPSADDMRMIRAMVREAGFKG